MTSVSFSEPSTTEDVLNLKHVSPVYKVVDRKINIPPENQRSIYSCLRLWVENDPYYKLPKPTGSTDISVIQLPKIKKNMEEVGNNDLVNSTKQQPTSENSIDDILGNSLQNTSTDVILQSHVAYLKTVRKYKVIKSKIELVRHIDRFKAIGVMK